ncbi:MAG: hypothetical protein ACLTC3_05255 [Evtepia gabavorous]
MPFVDLHCDTIARLLACRRAGLPGQLRTGEGAHVTLEKTPAERIPAPELCPVCQFAGGDAAPLGKGPVPRTFTACPWAAGRGRRWRRF